ncbi:putative RNA-dependent RNA polymerase 5 isoform X2 [Tasmannia lanceolata]|uniref:putative RNA-dependent RNA polymerase 5 isoform X2 n=1 Tax=Tasmannia lanceolata TaxID=3420 RepID=UPI004063DD6C
MDSSYLDVVLPPSVEEMLRKICQEQSFPWPDIKVRKKLVSIGELAALDLLRDIQTWRIRNLNASIMYKANRVVTISDQESVCSPGPQASSSSSRQEEWVLLSSPIRPVTEASPHLLALGELEFKKAFLILSYIGRKKLEEVMPVDKIQELKYLPMHTFEPEAWKVAGQQCISHNDRIKNFDWDSEKTHLYQCLVNQDGSFTFKGPFIDKKKTHLQRVLGDENILDVRFAEDGFAENVYDKIVTEGIVVGLRRYRFFVFKGVDKREKKKSPGSSFVKCFFVCTESNAVSDENVPYILFNKSIHEARSVFMHVHTVSTMSKYMARFCLILSKTVKLEVDLASVDIERIADIPCMDEEGNIIYSADGEALIHTDGTGFISEDLAMKCPRNIFKGDCLIPEDPVRILDQVEFEEKPSSMSQCKSLIDGTPLLIQFRLFFNGSAVKGTLLVNKTLPPKTIQIRKSMVKVEMDPELPSTPSVNSLEIVMTSNRPKKAYLSKNLIALLNYGGVQGDYFKDLLTSTLDDAHTAHSDKRVALRVEYGEMDNFLVSRMISCGIPLDEPFLQYRLSALMREDRKGLKGGRLPVSESYYLMGTTDPTGTLSPNEVCVILENGQISGNVLVYRNPGLHFGDIHVLIATYVKDLENIVGNYKYAIFFPTKGQRSLGGEIANGDYDGDMYWVSRNPHLLESFQPSKPWEPISSKMKMHQPKPTQYSPEQLENELFRLFFVNRFQPSYAAGTAADSWLAYMDRLLTLGDECVEEKKCLRDKMLKLVDIYYDAVDAPKTGMKVEVPRDLKADKFPHFLEKKNCYKSTSILGSIYDIVDSFQSEDLPTREVWQLPCFIQRVPSPCLEIWKQHYEQYRKDMTDALSIDDEFKNIAADEVIQKYKQILYGAAEFKESMRNKVDIFNEARAIYQITYDYAKTKGVEKCGFAWKVAGRALCKLYAMEQNEDPIMCSPSVLREVLR